MSTRSAPETGHWSLGRPRPSPSPRVPPSSQADGHIPGGGISYQAGDSFVIVVMVRQSEVDGEREKNNCLLIISTGTRHPLRPHHQHRTTPTSFVFKRREQGKRGTNPPFSSVPVFVRKDFFAVGSKRVQRHLSHSCVLCPHLPYIPVSPPPQSALVALPLQQPNPTRFWPRLTSRSLPLPPYLRPARAPVAIRSVASLLPDSSVVGQRCIAV
ncbi:hypothetical protein B0T10DRAFT_84948 [Thelonectria olida]|uniref:Uncharacterized protein n=1 Tax=Thelonectria olida TaxID=1576542 RepID=A0A9P8VZ52_9HYPO|nr:hypothetical protein B0T10DRAFT_84948 [Thelonectria olida]